MKIIQGDFRTNSDIEILQELYDDIKLSIDLLPPNIPLVSVFGVLELLKQNLYLDNSDE